MNVRRAHIEGKGLCTLGRMDRFRPFPHNVRMAKQAHFLRSWRKHRDLTLEKVAERVGTTHATLSRIERGKLPYNQALLEILAEIYQTDTGSLLMRDPSQPDALWSIWDQLAPVQKQQVTEIAQTLKRTGTGG